MKDEVSLMPCRKQSPIEPPPDLANEATQAKCRVLNKVKSGLQGLKSLEDVLIRAISIQDP